MRPPLNLQCAGRRAVDRQLKHGQDKVYECVIAANRSHYVVGRPHSHRLIVISSAAHQCFAG